ncbi:MAG: MBL fold metallo-hydrolase [Clostridiales bacterium]|nr:MBL fold metallo-hydrolase [Clostridiales bacterium]
MKQYFLSNKVSGHVIRIKGLLNEYMYLITGEKQALLVDTGCGAGNIKEYIAGLTQLPVVVMATHGHYDHIGGSSRFPEIYIGQKEVESQFLGYKPEIVLHELQELGIDINYLDMSPADIPSFLWLHDGMVFDLGNIHAEVILCPGHTVESYCVSIQEERLLITGDACHHITYLFFNDALTVSEFQKSIIHLNFRSEEWDKILFSHSIGEAPKEMLEEVIQVCDRIIEGKAKKISFEAKGCKGYIAEPVNANMQRKDHILGNVIYNDKKII